MGVPSPPPAHVQPAMSGSGASQPGPSAHGLARALPEPGTGTSGRPPWTERVSPGSVSVYHAPCEPRRTGPSRWAEGGFFGSERWRTHVQCICKKTPRRGHVRSTGLCAERCSCDRPPVKATAQRQQTGALASPVGETGP